MNDVLKDAANDAATSTTTPAGQRERRAGLRTRAEVEVAYRQVGASVTSSTRDISEGGVFIACANPPALGTELEIILSTPEAPLRLEATVVRVVWGGRRGGKPVAAGMALSFRFQHADERAVLSVLLASHR